MNLPQTETVFLMTVIGKQSPCPYLNPRLIPLYFLCLSSWGGREREDLEAPCAQLRSTHHKYSPWIFSRESLELLIKDSILQNAVFSIFRNNNLMKAETLTERYLLLKLPSDLLFIYLLFLCSLSLLLHYLCWIFGLYHRLFRGRA